jgi:hypothetical protein
MLSGTFELIEGERKRGRKRKSPIAHRIVGRFNYFGAFAFTSSQLIEIDVDTLTSTFLSLFIFLFYYSCSMYACMHSSIPYHALCGCQRLFGLCLHVLLLSFTIVTGIFSIYLYHICIIIFLEA